MSEDRGPTVCRFCGATDRDDLCIGGPGHDFQPAELFPKALLADLEARLSRAEEALRAAGQVLEQWPDVALALVRRDPVRNLDELIVATECALASHPKEKG